PAKVNAALQQRVLEGAEAITCRPADLLQPELDKLQQELSSLAKTESIRLADQQLDDVLTYALFPQVGLKFLKNRDNPAAFEPVPDGNTSEHKAAAPSRAKVPQSGPASYSVRVDGKVYEVEVAPGGELSSVKPV